MELHSFVFSTVALLFVATIAVSLSKKIGLGAILGLLTAGIVLGPNSFGLLGSKEVEDVRHFTELGVVFLLFLIGLEIKPRHLWDMRKSLFGMGGLQILLSTAVLSVFLWFMGYTQSAAIVMAASLALSSTAFVVQMLRDRSEMNTPQGKAAFAVLLMQDIAVVPLLSLLPLLSEKTAIGAFPWDKAGMSVLVIGGVLVVGKYVVPWLLDILSKHDNREAFFMMSMFSMFGAAAAMEYVGMSMGLGAFLIGMMLSTSKYSYQIEMSIDPHKGILMSLFFIAVGMSIDLRVITNNPLSFGATVFGVMGLNIAIMIALALMFGYNKSTAIKSAFLLSQGGEFGFVVFGAAKLAGVIEDQMFATGVALISVSMLLTPLITKIGYFIADKYPTPVDTSDALHDSSTDEHARVVIAGYGRVGHTIGTILKSRGISFIAFEMDAELVKKWRKEGHPVFYGDVSNPSLFQNNHVQGIELLVMTIHDSEIALKVSQVVKSNFPHITIVARARDLSMCDVFSRAGVEISIPETLEASLSLASSSLRVLGEHDAAGDSLIESVRRREISPNTRETEK